MVAGVGGQGVVYLTNLLVEAALLADIPVATSEIHGLSQRGGSVTAAMTFGEHGYGFIEKAGADFLLGLEVLEAYRCLPYLNKNSQAVIDSNKKLPYLVNAGKVEYPEPDTLKIYLETNIKELVFVEDMPEEVISITRNIFVAGCATQLEGFPVSYKQIKEAIISSSKSGYEVKSLKALEMGMEYQKRLLENIQH